MKGKKTTTLLKAIAFGTILPMATSTYAGADRSALYKVVFVPTWNAASHPVEYPTGLGHFSPLIGATHATGYHIFKVGTKPTPGLENLSEHGQHNPLDEEINAAIKAGKAGSLIETKEPLKGEVHQPASTTFTATTKFPMVSMVAMIAPSPDWFVGVGDVNLYKNGKWVPTVTVDAYAWDSGGDDGQTYQADDKDTNPKKPTTMAKTKHFTQNGKQVPVGVFVFTRIPGQ